MDLDGTYLLVRIVDALTVWLPKQGNKDYKSK